MTQWRKDKSVQQRDAAWSLDGSPSRHHNEMAQDGALQLTEGKAHGTQQYCTTSCQRGNNADAMQLLRQRLDTLKDEMAKDHRARSGTHTRNEPAVAKMLRIERSIQDLVEMEVAELNCMYRWRNRLVIIDPQAYTAVKSDRSRRGPFQQWPDCVQEMDHKDYKILYTSDWTMVETIQADATTM